MGSGRLRGLKELIGGKTTSNTCSSLVPFVGVVSSRLCVDNEVGRLKPGGVIGRSNAGDSPFGSNIGSESVVRGEEMRSVGLRRRRVDLRATRLLRTSVSGDSG